MAFYTGTPRYPGPYNTFLPEPTGMAVAFIRKPDEFRINDWCTLVPSDKPVGLYTVLDPDQPARVTSDASFHWPRGTPAPAPEGHGNIGNFLEVEFRTQRRAIPYTIDEETVGNASGGIKWKAFFDQTIVQQDMTNRTDQAVKLLEATANWGSNTDTAGNLNGSGAPWSAASNDPSNVAYLAIQRSLEAALEKIHIATNGIVRPKDMRLVLSPTLARTMSRTSEVHDYMKGQEDSIEVLTGDKPSVSKTANGEWGLPARLYGVEVAVEDAVIVREPQNAAGTPASTNRSYVKSANSAVLVSRKNGLDSDFGTKNYSTITVIYHKYQLAIESEHRTWDKLWLSRCVSDFVPVLTAPAAGFLITGVL